MGLSGTACVEPKIFGVSCAIFYPFEQFRHSHLFLMTRTERVCDPLREQARLTSVLKYRRFVDGAKVSHDPSLSGQLIYKSSCTVSHPATL